MTVHQLPYTCPSCKREFRGITSMQHATQVITRTCQSYDCREAWQLKITPRAIAGGQVDICEFTFLGIRPPKQRVYR